LESNGYSLKGGKWWAAVAARGEIGREGCEISSLVEHMGLSLSLAVFISGVSSHYSSPNLIKLVIFSCFY